MSTITITRKRDRIRIAIDAATTYEDWQHFCSRLDRDAKDLDVSPVVFDCIDVGTLPSIAYAAIFTIAYRCQQQGITCLVAGASDRIRRDLRQIGVDQFLGYLEDWSGVDEEDEVYAALEPKAG